jgi:hypothetical protein
MEAQKHLADWGIPVVHIEAHGVTPTGSEDEEPMFTGADGPPLRWRDMGRWLSPLNEASGHSMLIVSASCWGQAAIASMNVFSHCAPYALCVGFTTKVSPASIHAAMRDFYWCLVQRGETFKDAIASAKRELFDAGEELKHDMALTLGYQILRQLIREKSKPEYMAGLHTQMSSKFDAIGVQLPADYPEELPDAWMQVARRRCQQVWDCWFPPALQRANAIYRLNWSVVEQE